MKIKNAFAISLVFLFPLIAVAEEQSKTGALTPDEVLFGTTPLEFAAKNLRSFIQRYDVATLKNRLYDTMQSKTARFNQSFVSYIKQVYNDPNYALMLSQDSSHIVEFLDLSEELNLETATTYECLRLFYNKLKSCEIIDDAIVLAITRSLPTKFKRHFDFNLPSEEPRSIDFIKKNTENIILSRLTEEFAFFQKDPELFVDTLAQTLATANQEFFLEQSIAHKKHLDKVDAVTRLRSLTLRFFDVLIAKIMWIPEAQEACWDSFITIGEELKNLGAEGVIDHMDDLDDLWWTLTHRFSFFVDFMGYSLSRAFYEKAETDLANKTVHFLETPEQDEGITTKKEFIINALIQGKAKAIAFEKGFMIDNKTR